MVHGSIPIIQELIAQQIVIAQIELTSAVVKALLIPNPREIKPLRMTKFISWEEKSATDHKSQEQIIEMNQSINQSINRWIDKWTIDQSIHQSIKRVHRQSREDRKWPEEDVDTVFCSYRWNSAILHRLKRAWAGEWAYAGPCRGQWFPSARSAWTCACTFPCPSTRTPEICRPPEPDRGTQRTRWSVRPTAGWSGCEPTRQSSSPRRACPWGIRSTCRESPCRDGSRNPGPLPTRGDRAPAFPRHPSVNPKKNIMEKKSVRIYLLINLVLSIDWLISSINCLIK